MKKKLSTLNKSLETELNHYPELFQQRRLELALRSIPIEVKAVKQKAITEVFHKEIEKMDDSAKDLIERMLTYMEKKCVSIPMKAAREALAAN